MFAHPFLQILSILSHQQITLFPIRNRHTSLKNATDNELESKMMNTIKDILENRRIPYYFDEKYAFEEDCVGKVQSDLAAVVVSIGSPKFSRITKGVTITMVDKIATFGKIIMRQQINLQYNYC